MTEEMKTVDLEIHMLILRLKEWYDAHRGTRIDWGGRNVAVTLQSAAYEIGVAYSTFQFWIKAGNNEPEGRYPKGLNIDALRNFLDREEKKQKKEE